MTAILGISAFYHDSAAALVVDGEIAAAAQEERFTRIKNDQAFPIKSIEYCLSEARISGKDLDYVGFYDKPILKSGRLLDTYLAFAPIGFESFLKSLPLWLHQKLHLTREMRRGLNGEFEKAFIFLEHHESHAASAFFPSPFEDSAILTADGVGEWATATIGLGRKNRVELLQELLFPHSLGLLYSAFTYFTGFKVNSDEYKLMGLAPYGEPIYLQTMLDNLIDLKEDGSFRLDLSYFNYCQGMTMTSPKMDALFGGPPRTADGTIAKREMDLAASIQKLTEEIVLRMARKAHSETGMKKLCLSGGVALNCVANGRLLHEGPFDEIWIQPASGDAGSALGTALFIWHQLLGKDRNPTPSDSQRGSLLGPSYDDDEIKTFLDGTNAIYRTFDSSSELTAAVAQLLADGNVIGWFQGRAEFGPRALGARSILGDPRRPEMQAVINNKVKFREGFRPFAPAVLQERASEFFELPADLESPYMLIVTSVKPSKLKRLTPAEAGAEGLTRLKIVRSAIPAVTHVDGSARIQTVDAERHGLFYRVIKDFEGLTGCPLVVNTSFNLGWDPMVCAPKEAYQTFMQSGIDALCMGSHLLIKKEQPARIQAHSIGGRDAMLADLLRSPCHQALLTDEGERSICVECGRSFGSDDGIRQMFASHQQESGRDVTEEVKSFYEEIPFPNYDDHDTLRSLIDKSRAGVYARKLDEAIPFNSTVLEVGCGTGQLTNFLGISCRRAIGTDLCLNSLRLAESFRRAHGLDQVRFVQMNLFRPCFAPESFDVVLCNGVLHHTGDPVGGFRSLVPLVRPGGFMVVGLYNTLGRVMTDARRQLFRLTRGRLSWIDPFLRSRALSGDKRRAWMADQYFHPHESKHWMGEILGWIDDSGLEFVRAIPSLTPSVDALEADNLFDPAARAGRLARAGAQLKLAVTSGWEGGLFIMIARKPG